MKRLENTNVRIDAKGIESGTLVAGLRNRINARKLKIKVAQRGEKIYLVKK